MPDQKFLTNLEVAGRAVIGVNNTIDSSYVTHTTIIGRNNNTADTGVTTGTSVILGDGDGGRYGNVVISERTLKLGTDDNVANSSSNSTAIIDINNNWRAGSAFSNIRGFLGYFTPPTTSHDIYWFYANDNNSLTDSSFGAGNSPEAAIMQISFSPNFGTNSAGNSSNTNSMYFAGNASSAGAVYITASNQNTSSRGVVTIDGRYRNQNYEIPDGQKIFEVTSGYGRTKFVVESGGQNNEASIGIQKDIFHLGDTDTFFGFTGADTFAVTTGGTQRLSIGNSGATFSDPVTFSSSITVNGTSTFGDPATFDSDLTLDGISSMTETTALVMNGGNEVGYRTLGSNAFNSTTIPTNNNQLTNGAGYTTNTGDITAVTAGDYLSGGATSGAATLNLDVGGSGDWWGKGVAVQSNGVMEVGKYIDFHDADAGTSDYDFRITSTSGRLYFSGDIEVDGGDIYINDGNTRLTEGSNNSLRVQTDTGYVDIGAQNSSYSHFSTDRPVFYFNKGLTVDTGVIRSYDENLELNRAGSSTARLRITSGTTISDQNLTVDAGNSTTLSVKCNDSGLALVRANGDNQGTGALEVGQSDSYGGGISYNGDNSPAFVSGETADHITFYRMSNGTRTEVFSYPYSSDTVSFNGDINVSGGDIVLGGTGRIQGIDTVSAGTDAANKTYVDNHTYSHNHAASEITSGTFSTARIPNLAASKITSGTFDAARIPNLNASKITSGTFSDLFAVATRYNIGLIDGSSSQTRDKLRVWNSSSYTIGMKSGFTYGHLGDYAMSFQMNDDSDRGWWWGDTGHTDAQGAMSLTTNGRLVVATSLSVGQGETVTSPSTEALYVNGSADVSTNVIANGHFYGRSVNSQYSNIYRMGGIYFTWDSDSYGTNTHHSIRSTYGDSAGDDLTINSYHHLRINIDSNNNNTDEKFEIGQNTTGTGNVRFRVLGTGAVYAANDVVAFYSFSDKRLKTDIKPTTGNLEKILKLKPIEYRWKDGGRDGKKEIGLIAQEVEKIVPEVVRENNRLSDDDETLYKQVDYEHLVSTLIGAVQEQQKQINELKSIINGGS
jgi:hypothetical protein